MYTQCPSCNTVFRVHAGQLVAAHGKVRCGRCLHIFKAAEYAITLPPVDSQQATPLLDTQASAALEPTAPIDTGQESAWNIDGDAELDALLAELEGDNGQTAPENGEAFWPHDRTVHIPAESSPAAHAQDARVTPQPLDESTSSVIEEPPFFLHEEDAATLTHESEPAQPDETAEEVTTTEPDAEAPFALPSESDTIDQEDSTALNTRQEGITLPDSPMPAATDEAEFPDTAEQFNAYSAPDISDEDISLHTQDDELDIDDAVLPISEPDEILSADASPREGSDAGSHIGDEPRQPVEQPDHLETGITLQAETGDIDLDDLGTVASWHAQTDETEIAEPPFHASGDEQALEEPIATNPTDEAMSESADLEAPGTATGSPGEAPDTPSAAQSHVPEEPEAIEELVDDLRHPHSEQESLAAQLLESKPEGNRPLALVLWLSGILLMTTLLPLQYAYYNRNTLAADTELRPWLERLCKVTGCMLPPQRNTDAFVMLEHTIQSHPRYRDGLLITATLQNGATFNQPFPLIELRMTDMNQDIVASRRFKPEEYLAGVIDIQRGINAGDEANLMLEIHDPGRDAVGFEFHFY